MLGICRRCLGGESVLLFSSLQMAAIIWGTPCNATSLLHPFPMQALCLQPFLIRCLGLHAVIAKAWLTAVQLSSVQVLLLVWHGEQPGEISYRTSKHVWSQRFKKCGCEWNGNEWRKKKKKGSMITFIVCAECSLTLCATKLREVLHKCRGCPVAEQLFFPFVTLLLCLISSPCPADCGSAPWASSKHHFSSDCISTSILRYISFSSNQVNQGWMQQDMRLRGIFQLNDSISLYP